MDSNGVPQEWIGETVVVYLDSKESGVEILGMLDEVGEDGIKVSHIGELGRGPVIFCPWTSLRDLRLQSSPRPPFDDDEFGMLLPHGEPEDETNIPERLQHPSARALERVVPVAQKLTVGGITVAISSLELYEGGIGVLRWQVHFGEAQFQHGEGFGIPEPWFEIRDGEGRTLPWSPQGAGAGGRDADGDVRVGELPEAGELEVEVTRLVPDPYEEGERAGDGTSYEGPWTFRFSL